MAEYDNTNSGVLFKNEDKKKDGANPNWPDYKGSINIDGTDYWLSAWIKEAKDGSKFMSLARGDMKKGAKPAAKSKPAFNGDMSDDIPFDNPYRGITRCYAV